MMGDDDDMIAWMNSAAQWRSAHYTRPVRSSISILLRYARRTAIGERTADSLRRLIHHRKPMNLPVMQFLRQLWTPAAVPVCVSSKFQLSLPCCYWRFHCSGNKSADLCQGESDPDLESVSGLRIRITSKFNGNFSVQSYFCGKISIKIRSVFAEIWAKRRKMPSPAILQKILDQDSEADDFLN